MQVGRAHGRHEVRVAVPVQRDRARRSQLAAQQRQQLLQRLRPVGGAGDRHVVPIQPGHLVGRQVVARAHHGHHEAHAAPAQVLDLGGAAVGAMRAPASSGPLERAQLARPRPPDSPRLLNHKLHIDAKSGDPLIRPPQAR
jgi:hypothetical protein